MFDPTSRYYAIPNAEHVDADGTRIVYKQRRFLPQPDPSVRATRVVVSAGDRLDIIAAQTIGDPLLFWWIADANAAMDPFDLTAPGARLIIPTGGMGL